MESDTAHLDLQTHHALTIHSWCDLDLLDHEDCIDILLLDDLDVD